MSSAEMHYLLSLQIAQSEYVITIDCTQTAEHANLIADPLHDISLPVHEYIVIVCFCHSSCFVGFFGSAVVVRCIVIVNSLRGNLLPERSLF